MPIDNKLAPTNCEHRFGYWDSPIFIDKLTETCANIYILVPQLVQTRQCLECGEAEVREVK